MQERKFILAIDQGTTGTKVVIYNKKARIISCSYREITCYYPQPGWVELNPQEIWKSCLTGVKEAIQRGGIEKNGISVIAIANQRETVLVWDRSSGQPLGNAIVWQCRRTASFCNDLKRKGWEDFIRKKSGLLLDAYFSASKIRWILDSLPEVRRKAEKGEVICGTIDTWLIWKLTGGKVHLTDYTNASRTMLFNIHKLAWDPELLELFQIPASILPSVRASGGIYGYTASHLPLNRGIPIAAVLGDQQAALFGQACFDAGTLKSTYGTGCFLLLNTGKKLLSSEKLLTTIACDGDGKPVYALEGSIFTCGAVVQWLRDGLGLIKKAKDTEEVARRVEDTEGVYLVPAFTGLGAPYWDPLARGAILGISRATKKEQIIRASLESIAYQVRDIIEVMEKEAKIKVEKLRVDGGAAENNWLMQFQSDILSIPVERPAIYETTSLGVALLAGLTVGFWKDQRELVALCKSGVLFLPKMDEGKRENLYQGWKKAVSRVLSK